MEWTNKPPTEPGWYWVLCSLTPDLAGWPHIRYIETDDLPSYAEPDKYLKWSGPILEPKE